MHDTDAEQIAAIKGWWQENSRLVIVSLVVLLGSNYGWQAWHNHKAHQASLASESYQQVLESLSTHANAMQVKQHALAVRKQFPNSPYASLASLQLAKLAVQRGDYPAATSALQWVVDRGHTAALTQVAGLRLARVQLAQQQAKAALATLDGLANDSFAPLIAEVRGDVLQALKQPAQAKQAYAKALTALGKANNPALEALRLKHAQL